MIFKDRKDAGRLLANKLLKYKNENPIILALPRGGVPVGAQIASLLGAPLEILAVRKLGAPFNPELALGAICEDVIPVLSDTLLSQVGLKPEDLSDVVESEKKEIKRQIQKYRGGYGLPNLKGQTVIVADDGLATGATIMAAVKYLRSKCVAWIVVAVPIAATSSAQKVRSKVDEFVCVEESDELLAIGYWYEDFSQVVDEEVQSYLKLNNKFKGMSAKRVEGKPTMLSSRE